MNKKPCKEFNKCWRSAGSWYIKNKRDWQLKWNRKKWWVMPNMVWQQAANSRLKQAPKRDAYQIVTIAIACQIGPTFSLVSLQYCRCRCGFFSLIYTTCLLANLWVVNMNTHTLPNEQFIDDRIVSFTHQFHTLKVKQLSSY